MKRVPRTRTLLTGIGLMAAVLLVAAGCTAGGPVSYDEAEELREQIADMEDRLSDVESMLGEVENGELSDDAQQTIGAAADEVSAVLTSLGDVHEALEMPEIDSEVPPARPAPGGAAPGGAAPGGAGGTSM
ncbi:MAG: hypothetical protein ACOC1I_08095 [Spirochaetota bacterium]